MVGWQWHQLHHMQIICTLLQTDNHASTSCHMPFLTPNHVRALKAGFMHSVTPEGIKTLITRMWANGQRDGRPADHRWRRLFNAAKFG